MRLVFAGTPEFAERALARLAAAGHEIALVLTQPDRPAGRGLRFIPSPVKQFAAAQGMTLFQPQHLKSRESIDRVRAARPDALVVAAYGLILPQALLDAAPHGAINIHASLLPRWRGAAPIQRALLAGDRETGISIMQMDAGLDTGPVLQQRSIPIAPDDDAGTLHRRLADLGAEMIVESLAAVEVGSAKAVKQPEDGASYAHKIEKRDTALDWSRPATQLERAVRAFRPAPGASTTLEGEPIKIWRARLLDQKLAPAALLRRNDQLIVGCGQDSLAIEELQRAGGKKMSAAQFLRGRPLAAGARFE